ncbi:glycoside hydrolase family 18 protein [Didymella exigua CBS 183.55]|uniref:chitinase n=1 Tax=Didymella exigua CBS 183.55 TaxID=1150837 RepID=A0A6A5RJ97_9PLEO|nr:glycoside hydrolase family 18 protein [Didymella exigua CBS 183.55]KAF1927503.1 glycoside hydrolase family 18 protein [Didymella exigua CBS 183.55]
MRFLNSAALLALPFLAGAAPLQDARSTKAYQMGIFYVNWAIYGRQHFITDLPADKLTKVTYAFANVNSTTGEVFLSDLWADVQFAYPGDVASNGTQLLGNFNQLYKLKQQNRNLKTSLSVGGWSYRANFKTALATSAGRSLFAESTLKLIIDLGLDGIDVDWEYPEDATDAANLVETLRLCRELYDEYSAKYAYGYHFNVDVSAPAGPKNYNKLDIAGMDPYVTLWNLMAFDYMGPGFSNYTGHLSNVYPSRSNPRATDFNTVQAVDHYTSQIASSRKLILGMPLYGRSFANTNGLGQKFNGSGDGTWEAGVLDYKVLPLNGSTVYTDKKAIASWSYDNETRQFVTFDTPEVQTLKAKYLKKERLGGAWWWDSSSDRKDDKSLVSTVSEALGGVQGLQLNQNNLYYPLSKYDNIRGTAANATIARLR